MSLLISNSLKIRVTFLTLMMSILSVSCGKDDSDSISTTETADFSSVSSIISNKCGNSGCHGTSNASSTIYVSNETNVVSDASTILTRINSTSNPMPPSGNTALTSSEKETLTTYLEQF